MDRSCWRFTFYLSSLVLITLLAACTGETTTPGNPSFTPLPSNTPRPSQTPTPTETPLPTATITSTPKPTIQLPKQALTPLALTPLPISVENAGRIAELTRWEVTNPAFWQKSDGNSALAGVKDFPASWDFQLVFSSDGTSMNVIPIEPPSDGKIVRSSGFFENRYISCHFWKNIGKLQGGWRYSKKGVYPEIPLLSIPSGKQIRLFTPNIQKYINSDYGEYLYSPNGEELVVQGEYCQLQFLHIETGISSKKFAPMDGDRFGFSVDGKIFFSGINEDGGFALYNPQNGNILQQTQVEWKRLAEFSQIGIQQLEVEKQNGKIVNFTVMSDEKDKHVDTIAIASDGKSFISSISTNNTALVKLVDKDGGGKYVYKDGFGKQRIVLWQTSNGAMRYVLVEKEDWKEQPIAAYSPDSRKSAIYIDASLKIGLYDLASGKQTGTLGKSGYLNLTYSPDGQILIAGTETSLELWDIATGKLLAAISIPAKLDGWAISPDGRYIGTTSQDGKINLWGVAP